MRTLLQRYDFVLENKQDDENITGDALVGMVRGLIIRMEDNNLTESGKHERIGELISMSLREHIDIRYEEISSAQDDATRDDEHIQADRKERASDFANAHHDVLGER
mgnify:CR=1 FL=1